MDSIVREGQAGAMAQDSGESGRPDLSHAREAIGEKERSVGVGRLARGDREGDQKCQRRE